MDVYLGRIGPLIVWGPYGPPSIRPWWKNNNPTQIPRAYRFPLRDKVVRPKQFHANEFRERRYSDWEKKPLRPVCLINPAASWPLLTISHRRRSTLNSSVNNRDGFLYVFPMGLFPWTTNWSTASTHRSYHEEEEKCRPSDELTSIRSVKAQQRLRITSAPPHHEREVTGSAPIHGSRTPINRGNYESFPKMSPAGLSAGSIVNSWSSHSPPI